MTSASSHSGRRASRYSFGVTTITPPPGFRRSARARRQRAAVALGGDARSRTSPDSRSPTRRRGRWHGAGRARSPPAGSGRSSRRGSRDPPHAPPDLGRPVLRPCADRGLFHRLPLRFALDRRRRRDPASAPSRPTRWAQRRHATDHAPRDRLPAAIAGEQRGDAHRPKSLSVNSATGFTTRTVTIPPKYDAAIQPQSIAITFLLRA